MSLIYLAACAAADPRPNLGWLGSGTGSTLLNVTMKSIDGKKEIRPESSPTNESDYF